MTIESFGDDVRIEQRYAPVRAAQRLRIEGGSATTKAGNPITSNVINLDASGNPIYAWVLYRRQLTTGGIHPWSGEKTSLNHVWMPVAEFNTYDEAVTAANAEQTAQLQITKKKRK